MLVTTIDYEQATPSLSQAQRMKKFSQAGRLNEDSMLAIMSEEKKPEKFSLTFDGDRIRKYFPKSYTPLQMENIDSKAPGPQETIVAKSTRPSVLEGLRRPMPPRAADKKSKTHEEVR